MKIFRKLVLGVGAIAVMIAAGATNALANPGSLATTTILGHRATLAQSSVVSPPKAGSATSATSALVLKT